MKKTIHRVDSGLLGGSEKATKSKLMAEEGTQLAGCLLSFPLGGYKQHPHGLCLAEITQGGKNKTNKQKKRLGSLLLEEEFWFGLVNILFCN